MKTPIETNVPMSQSWALRLVAKWCDGRATQYADKSLLKRCRSAYKTGPMVAPVAQFADELEAQMKANADRWIALALEMRTAAKSEDAATEAEAVGKWHGA